MNLPDDTIDYMNGEHNMCVQSEKQPLPLKAQAAQVQRESEQYREHHSFIKKLHEFHRELGKARFDALLAQVLRGDEVGAKVLFKHYICERPAT